jgi:hypothetical protein
MESRKDGRNIYQNKEQTETNVEKILTHVSQLSCSHLNLVLPLAVMLNINIMCMRARACGVWQHRRLCMYKANTKYVSDIQDV